MTRVKIFSTTTCAYCRMLKEYLVNKGVNYNEVIVDQDSGALDEMLKESDGFTGVPFTVITKENGTKITIKGFDKNQINTALGIEN